MFEHIQKPEPLWLILEEIHHKHELIINGLMAFDYLHKIDSKWRENQIRLISHDPKAADEANLHRTILQSGVGAVLDQARPLMIKREKELNKLVKGLYARLDEFEDEK